MINHELPCCPLCDSNSVEIRHDRKARYRYLKVEHVLERQEHTVCSNCGTSFYQPGQIKRNNERFMAFAKAFVKNIAPWDILKIREIYGLSQEQANRIFQCGPTQFSKWERGEVAPTGTAAIALKEALDNPTFIRKLADRERVSIDAPQERATPQVIYIGFRESGSTQASTDIHLWAQAMAQAAKAATTAEIGSVENVLLKYSTDPLAARSMGGYVTGLQGLVETDDQPGFVPSWANAPANRPLLLTHRSKPRKSTRSVAHIARKETGQ